MTSPTLESTTVTSVTTRATTIEFDLPATVDAGDVLVLVCALGRETAYILEGSELAAWTNLWTYNLHGWHSWRAYYLVADGTEDGGTVSFTGTAQGLRGGANVLRISGAYGGALNVGVAFSVETGVCFTLNPDPPSVSAPWGSADQLYIACATTGSTGATYSAYPSGYSNGAQSSASAFEVVATATLAETSGSDDPAAMTITDGTAGENCRTGTIVIRPADATLDATASPAGGAIVAGATAVTFSTTSAPQVTSGLKFMVDFDGDDNFDTAVEDITSYVLDGAEILVGRDFPSQLTGKSVPGTFRARLLNTDGRFSPFLTTSPLNTSPYSLDLGKKVRVQIDGVAEPEPTLIDRDRFGTAGDVGTTEGGNLWAQVGGGGLWTVADGAVSCATDGSLIVDAGTENCFTQVTLRHVDADNGAGIVYRYGDDDNYGRVVVTPHSITHTEVTAGSPTTHTSTAIEARPYLTIGVLVDTDDDVTVYVDGTLLFTDTGDAHSAGGTGFGLWADFNNHRSPAFEEINVWDGLWSTSEGILFTGDLTDLKPSHAPGPYSEVTIEARGWLQRLAGPEVTPPTSIGVTAESTAGVTSGMMVGATLRSAQMLHPPPPGGLDTGQITLGGVGTGNAKALYVARLFEATEFGFLYELPEGPVDFDDRSARAAKAVMAAFTDTDGQFHPELLDLLDWRREVFNRVTAEVSPSTPVVENVITTTGNHAAGASAAITVTLPSGAQADAGDLDLVLIVPTCQLADEQIEAPTGWTVLRSPTGSGSSLGHEHWFARKLTSGDLSDSVTFYSASTTGGGAWICRQFVISGWYGAVESGVAISEATGATGSTAQAGTNDPPALLVPWGRQPTLFVATRSGLYTSSSGSASATDPDDAPNGYRDLDSDAIAASVSTADVASQYALRHGVTTVEDPSAFGGTFSGFDNLETSTVAVRGYAGDPPEQSTGELVTVEDLSSQATHNLVSTFPDQPGFFADTTAADTYADLVLARHGGQRPLFKVGFTATRSSLHRYLAYSLRLSDLVRVAATGQTNVGVNGLYHIESIRHVFSAGATNWWWEAQLSPVD